MRDDSRLATPRCMVALHRSLGVHLAAAHGIDVLLLRSLAGEWLNDGGRFSVEILDDASFRIVVAPAAYRDSIGRVIAPRHRAWRALAELAMRLL